MAAKTAPRRTRSSTIAALERHHGPGHPRAAELRAEVAAGQLADWVERARQLPALDPAEVAQVGAIAARLDARIAQASR